MKRLIVWAAAIAAVVAAGFGSGMALSQLNRWMKEPPAIRQGDFREIIASVGSPIVLLSTSSCPWCEKTREWLHANGVAYRDCIADKDEFAGSLLVEVGLETVPQLVTADSIVTGFDPERFAQVTREVQSWVAPTAVRCSLSTR